MPGAALVLGVAAIGASDRHQSGRVMATREQKPRTVAKRLTAGVDQLAAR
jgi:hypothetical protein